MDKPRQRAFPILVCLLLTNACGVASFNTPAQQDHQLVDTLAAQTWSVHETQLALSATPTPAPPTDVPRSSPTSPPKATTPPTITPTPAIPCNAANLVKDITIPNDTIFPPGVVFTKTWRIKNTGTCTWDQTYALVFVTGDLMDGEKTSLLDTTLPGGTTDVSVALIAPEAPDKYQGNWMLQSSLTTFGAGFTGKDMFSVSIQVAATQGDTTYNFAENYCSAFWENGTERLPCPGKENRPTGFVLQLRNPELESRKENEFTLWTNPQLIQSGQISGRFPPLGIQSGDHFLAEIGCLAGYTLCDVTFLLGVHVDGGDLEVLGEWQEIFDGQTTLIDQNLTSLAGKSVAFVFKVWANGPPEQSAAFWLMPQIQH